MLTRIEIDGFKTFRAFAVDVGPLFVVFGPNGSGKSNLFDAIQLLSRLANSDLRTALVGMRGEPLELFRTRSDGTRVDRMDFAVEVLLDRHVRDPWGAIKPIAYSRLRYEVSIASRETSRGLDRMYVVHELAKLIRATEDRWRPGGRTPVAEFRRVHVRRGNRSPFLLTALRDDHPTFVIKQDGNQGRDQYRSAEAAEATVLSSITSVEFPHLYALREEMRGWRFLQLNPAALRRPSSTIAAEELEPSGSNLATVLARIEAETRSETRPRGVIDDIQADLAYVVPGVQRLDVVTDEERRENRVEIQMRDGGRFAGSVVSDGTLRVLAILTLLHDPRHRGLVYFEEPENGVHPLRLKALVSRLRDLVTDPQDGLVLADPLSQLVMNSHSPVLLSELAYGEMAFADLVSSVGPGAPTAERITRIRPVRPVDQGTAFETSADWVSRFEVDRFLSTTERSG